MTIFKKIFVLFTLCLLTFFSQNEASASLPHYQTFDGHHYNFVQNIPSPPADGTHIFGTHKRSGNQLILTARGGNIIEVAAKDVKTGRIIVLEGNSTTCDSGGLCPKFVVKTCFTDPWGDCFCVCGPLTSNSDNSLRDNDENLLPLLLLSFSDSYVVEDMKQGTNVIDTDPATGTNLLVKVRGQQLIGMAVQYADGTIKSFEESKGEACSDSGPCHKFQAKNCYATPWGCVCVCGRFSTPTRN